MPCDEWMRRLGAQDDIKEEVLEGAFLRSFNDEFVARVLDAYLKNTYEDAIVAHLHKERT